MKTKELAALLHGHEVGDLPSELDDVARRSGLVVVIGTDQNTVRFFGAISGTADIPEGGTVYFDAEGILPDADDVPEPDRQAHYDRKRFALVLDADWNRDGFAWTFTTATSHKRFVLHKEGARWCRGIAFSMADAGLA
jgi:hypothetical protein